MLGRRVETSPDALRPDAAPAERLSPEDRGRLAELRVLHRQYQALANNPDIRRFRDPSRDALVRTAQEITALLNHLGLSDPTDAQRDLLPPEVREILDGLPDPAALSTPPPPDRLSTREQFLALAAERHNEWMAHWLAPEGSPGLFGPFHRTAYARQGPEVMRMILDSGELWGQRYLQNPNPIVEAHEGPLPDGTIGFEFYTDHMPNSWRRTIGGRVGWSLEFRRQSLDAEINEVLEPIELRDVNGVDTAVITLAITTVNQEIAPEIAQRDRPETAPGTNPDAGQDGVDPVTAVGVNASRFAGRFAARPDPAAVVDTATRAMAGVVPPVLSQQVAGIDDLGDGRFRIRPVRGRAFEVTITAEDLSSVQTSRSTDVVAHTTPAGRGAYQLRLSSRLDVTAVAEALAHELREVVALRSRSLVQRLVGRVRQQRDRLTGRSTVPTTGPLSGHDHGGLGQLDVHGHDRQHLPDQGWSRVRTVFEAAALMRHLGIDRSNLSAHPRRDRIRAENALTSAAWDLINELDGATGATDPALLEAIRRAHALAAYPSTTGDPVDLYAAWSQAVLQIAAVTTDPQARADLVAGFLDDIDPTHLAQLASRDPALHARLTAELPPGHRAEGRIPVDELRGMATRYETADDAGRLAIRRQLSGTVARYQAQLGQPGADRLHTHLPPDVRAFLDRLATPQITPADVQQVLANLAVNPAAVTSASRRDTDFIDNFGTQPLTEAALRDVLHQLAVAGERFIGGLPHLPHLAGQVVHLSQAALTPLLLADPALAQQVQNHGIYVDLRGVVDLTPFRGFQLPNVELGPAGNQFDLTDPDGRAAQRRQDTARARAVYAYQYSTWPGLSTFLATHVMHHVEDGRSVLPIHRALESAVASLVPPTPATNWVPDSGARPGGTTQGPVRITAHRPALVNIGPGMEYGRPLDGPNGRLPLGADQPSRTHYTQVGLGACGFFNAIRSVAGTMPAVITQAITENPDGTYTVRLHETEMQGDRVVPTGRVIEVTVTPEFPVRTGTNRLEYSAVRGAAWGVVLEKALVSVGQLWDATRRARWQQTWYGATLGASQQPNSTTPAPGQFEAAPTGYHEVGGVGTFALDEAEVLSLLTGRPARVSLFDTSPNQVAVTTQRLSQLLAARVPILVHTMAPSDYDTDPRHTSRNMEQTLPHDLVHGHAYEVVGLANGQVTLLNPWGVQHPAAMDVSELLLIMGNDYAHVDPPPAPPAPPQPPAPPAPPAPKPSTPTTTPTTTRRLPRTPPRRGGRSAGRRSSIAATRRWTRPSALTRHRRRNDTACRPAGSRRNSWW